MSRDPRADAAMRTSQGHTRGWDFREEKNADRLATAFRILPGFAFFAVVAFFCCVAWFA